ncbi:MAG: hypothetical protein BWY61_02119 [Firmicutes bacterium ADurb.Bin354]|nr:MAG: hypothetical protein BWY61_02119 [Firmicutes bacterium ADurb.Bin354]
MTAKETGSCILSTASLNTVSVKKKDKLKKRARRTVPQTGRAGFSTCSDVSPDFSGAFSVFSTSFSATASPALDSVADFTSDFSVFPVSVRSSSAFVSVSFRSSAIKAFFLFASAALYDLNFFFFFLTLIIILLEPADRSDHIFKNRCNDFFYIFSTPACVSIHLILSS